MKYLVQFLKLKKKSSYLHGSQRLRRVQQNRESEREAGRGVSTLRASSPGHATAKFPPGALAPVGWSLAESFAKDILNSVKCGGGFLLKLHKLTKKIKKKKTAPCSRTFPK